MENNKEINSIKIGKLQITSKSALLTIILSILFVFGFCIFCFTSCTRDITVEYIKYKKDINNVQKIK